MTAKLIIEQRLGGSEIFNEGQAIGAALTVNDGLVHLTGQLWAGFPAGH